MVTKETAIKAIEKKATTNRSTGQGGLLTEAAGHLDDQGAGDPVYGRADGGPTEAGCSLFHFVDETATTQPRKLGEFTIPGLGKLVKAQRAARIGRNPATGEAIKIEAKTTVKFRLAKSAVVPPKA